MVSEHADRTCSAGPTVTHSDAIVLRVNIDWVVWLGSIK